MKIDGYNIVEITSTDGVTLALKDEPGGPIITGKTKEEAISKFKEALKLSQAVKYLNDFKDRNKV